ncbi:inner membrane-associated protein [Escherichia coli K-12]|nr:inner membrane-associated protein [Escherichia coli K-12]
MKIKVSEETHHTINGGK